MGWTDWLNPAHDIGMIPGVNSLENSLGFQSPNSTASGQALSGDATAYTDIGTTAGSTLGYGNRGKKAAAQTSSQDALAKAQQGTPVFNEMGIPTGEMRVDPQAVQAAEVGVQAANSMPDDSTAGDMTAPTAAPVDWQQAPVTLAQAQGATAQQAGAASMTGAQLNAEQTSQDRTAEGVLAGTLQNTANGVGPSVAQEQLRQATAANINQQLAAAQSAHGAARLAALRGATMTNAATQQTAASQAAGLRAGEIATAQGQLGNVLNSTAGQDIGIASANAALLQQTGQTNAGYQQGANLLNAQLGTNTSQFNAANATGVNLANAGASNLSANNYAGAQNAGNLSLSEANLTSQENTNTLNTQRQQDYINSLLNAQGGKTGVDETEYAGQASYNANKRKMVGQTLNALGGAVGIPGMGGGGSGGGGSGGGGSGGGGDVGGGGDSLMSPSF